MNLPEPTVDLTDFIVVWMLVTVDRTSERAERRAATSEAARGAASPPTVHFKVDVVVINFVEMFMRWPLIVGTTEEEAKLVTFEADTVADSHQHCC